MKILEEYEMDKLVNFLIREQILVIFYNYDDSKKEQRAKDYSIVSTTFEMALFFITENRTLYE